MFSCFKSLNKKFICSICSSCLLCMTGVSQLRAEGEPLELGNTTVESAIANENMFLANTLQDHVYSSRLLPIFSQKPFLYVIDGKSILTLDETPSQDKIPFGTGTHTSVFIAAVPVNDASSDESYESDGSYYDDLTWYELDDNSWDKLCVRYPGTAKVFYHVVSTDNNIKGTIDDYAYLNVDRTTRPMDILSDNYFNTETKMLGFEYYTDTNVKKIAKISMNPTEKGDADFTFGEFLDNVMNSQFVPQKYVHQYDSEGRDINENLEINPTAYSLCIIIGEFASKSDNMEMIDNMFALKNQKAISYYNQNGNNEYEEGSSPWYDIYKFHQNTRILGFTFKDSGEIIRISDNPNDKGNADCTLTDFLDNVLKSKKWKMKDVLKTTSNPYYLEVLQFDAEGKRISDADTLGVNSIPAGICWIMKGLAEKNNNNEMRKAAVQKGFDYTH